MSIFPKIVNNYVFPKHIYTMVGLEPGSHAMTTAPSHHREVSKYFLGSETQSASSPPQPPFPIFFLVHHVDNRDVQHTLAHGNGL
jgi:hypothetical protein